MSCFLHNIKLTIARQDSFQTVSSTASATLTPTITETLVPSPTRTFTAIPQPTPVPPTSTPKVETAPATQPVPVLSKPPASTDRIVAVLPCDQYAGLASELAHGSGSIWSRGYTPLMCEPHLPSWHLWVVLAMRTGSADGYDQRAFFFYINNFWGPIRRTPARGLPLSGRQAMERLRYRMLSTDRVMGCAAIRGDSQLCGSTGAGAHWCRWTRYPRLASTRR